MTPMMISSIVLVCSFGAGLVGIVLHIKVPDEQLDTDTRDVVKLVMGLIATMSALVLGLLIASSKTAYDQQNDGLKELSVNIVLLDRTLAFYGQDAQKVRAELRDAIQKTHDRIWSSTEIRPEELNSDDLRKGARGRIELMNQLVPKTDIERELKSRALQLAETVSRSRLLLYERLRNSISWPFLAVLVFWVTILFLGFGIFSRFTPTIIVALLVGALSVAGAVFLILELGEPYRGMMRISDAPLLDTIAQISRE